MKKRQDVVGQGCGGAGVRDEGEIGRNCAGRHIRMHWPRVPSTQGVGVNLTDTV